ncbi:amidohydrolase family protein [Paraburkholderia sp. NPDC080076]|uniref:amidohydrolase family protein n=1 Tax=Paraburkholderia sp. NPDC080076 TaxID=3390605 RepID=UPI003D041E51
MTILRQPEKDEPVLDPEIPIIDAHQHLLDRPALRYMLDDYLADANSGHKIVASVYVETQAFARSGGPELLRPIGEIEFANGVAAMCESGTYGRCLVGAAIVGHADLRYGDAVADLLDRAQETAPQRLRAIRQITIEHSSDAPFRYMTNRPPVGALQDPQFLKGFGQLARRGLAFDAAVFHQQLPDICSLASKFPDTTIVLNHLGMPMQLELDQAGRMRVFSEWRDSLFELARRPNVVCKVGGLGMPYWDFGFDRRPKPVGYRELAAAWRPYIEVGIEAFGADRCMMESNFPPDRRSCSFSSLWNAMKYVVRDCTPEEKASLFHDTAARIYRMAITSG